MTKNLFPELTLVYNIKLPHLKNILLEFEKIDRLIYLLFIQTKNISNLQFL